MSLRVTHIPQTFPRSVSLQPCAYLRWGTGSGRRKVSGCLAAIERDRTSGKYHLPKRLRRPRRRFPGAIPRSKDRAQFGTSAVIGPRSVMWTAQQPGGGNRSVHNCAGITSSLVAPAMQLSCISLAEMLATQRIQTHGKQIGSIDRGLAHDLLYYPSNCPGRNERRVELRSPRTSTRSKV